MTREIRRFSEGTNQKREELRQADLARIVEDSVNEIYIFDEQTLQFIEVNRSARENLGYTMEDFARLTPLDLKPEITRESFQKQVETLRFGQSSKIVFETVHRRKNATEYPVEIHLQMGTYAGYRVFIAIVLDISERKKVLDALRESEERFRTLFENAPEALVVMDVELGRFVDVNPNACRLFAMGRDDLLRYGPLELSPPVQPNGKSSREEGREKIQQAASGMTLHFEWTHRDALGHDIPCEVYLVRMPSSTRSLVRGSIVDITERKRAEEELKEAQMIANYGSWSWDLKTNEVIWSDNLYKIHGIAMGTPMNFEKAISFIHPEDLEAVQTKVRLMLTEKKTTEFEYRIKTEGGIEKVVRGQQKFIFDAEGDILRLIGTVQDITERKRAEAERWFLERQMQHTQKLESLGILAGGIAHDFNNLLTSILGYSDLARLELPPESATKNYIDEVVKGARRAAELTQQMLAYSGKGRFVVQPVNLSMLVEEMTRLLEVSISKKCVLNYQFSADLPSFEADAVQIRQIVMNLVINASEAIGDRNGVISISTGGMFCDREYLGEMYLNENLPEGQYVYLEVSDTGCGMSEEMRMKIFDPFFTTKFMGRGLGLAAVLGIVRGHRGAIKVYSEMGKGSVFKVLFPSLSQAVVEREVRAVENSKWVGQGSVLVIDDEELVRGLASQMMKKMGFCVLTAVNGREGVEIFQKDSEKIRLILLDMTMPEMDGEETFREIQRIKSGVRTILSSGYNEQTVTNQFVGKGLASFIQKPYRYWDLVKVVRQVLGE